LSLGLVVLLGWTVPAGAVNLQYRVSTGQVTSEPKDTPIPAVPGYAVYVDAGQTAATFVWPAPVGCAQGRQEWTLVLGGVLQLNPELTTTAAVYECAYIVHSRAEVKRAFREQLTVLLAAYESEYTPMAPLLAEITARCTTTNASTGAVTPLTTAGCIAERQAANALVAQVDDTVRRTFLTAVKAMWDRGQDLIAAKGW
jgi:hypothetical protein